MRGYPCCDCCCQSLLCRGLDNARLPYRLLGSTRFWRVALFSASLNLQSAPVHFRLQEE